MQRLSARTFVVMFYDSLNILLAFLTSNILINPLVLQMRRQYFIDFASDYLVILCIQLCCFYFLNVYRAIIRFSSIPDLLRIVRGVVLAVPLSAAALHWYNPESFISVSLFIVNGFLLVLGLSSGRLAYRMMKDRAVEKIKHLSAHTVKKVFIVGAGVTGEKLLREISMNPNIPLSVVGFIDDNSAKIGKSIRGINIFGPINKLPALVEQYQVQQIVIAIPSASQDQVRRITEVCKSLGQSIELKILPKMSDFLSGKLFYKALRNIEPEDLLGRKAHDLDIQQMSSMLRNKVILVTGAGGSIGSELSQQIAKFEPRLLILLEMTELFLYELEHRFKKAFPNLKCEYVVGDVRNKSKLESIFKKYNPEVVFHSAAYKHVPLMELNPFESVRTNILGTLNVAQLAAQYTVQRFVLISTDKAINPTNVMGATKRVAELICQFLQTQSTTKFITVRFGNVLGSSGSVIPLFKKQIEQGGPVTVTHPEMRRYFMSIPEATQLVIQAGSLGNGGEIMLLDMGQPMRIYDLAKEMIELAGFKPNIDIPIEFTGLRPGEKLFEELFYEGETMLPTRHPMVKIAKTTFSYPDFQEQLDTLLSLPEDSDPFFIKQNLKKLVCEYQIQKPSEMNLI